MMRTPSAWGCWGLVCVSVALGCAPSPMPEADAGETRDAATSDVSPLLDAAPVRDAGPGCADADGDHHQDVSCGGDDCDDADAARFPGNPETCDPSGHDEDCDPTTLGVRDADADGYTDVACCNGSVCGDDCDDARAVVHPTATEACDQFDNDCDGALDEGVSLMVWPDADGDMFGDPAATPVLGCVGPHLADNGDDCDDARAAVNPASPEVCNGIDDDCNALLDGPNEDDDRDGHADDACAGARGTDCDDTRADVHDGAPEICDGVDQDCNGVEDPAGRCVECGASSSPTGCAGTCCARAGSPTPVCGDPSCNSVCAETPPAPNYVAELRCDGPEDCATGRCCFLSAGACSVPTLTDCFTCGATQEACHRDSDCMAPFRCRTYTTFPATPDRPIHRCG